MADGTVFSVGWNDIGGYRLWLRDQGGNEFYYAHLSAYSPFAVNGRQVKAGTVLGFMGNTGDASTTPYHLHFEIHRSACSTWATTARSARTRTYGLAAPAGRRVRTGRRLGAAGLSRQQRPEAGRDPALATDISTADGLDPGSLQRALKQAAKQSNRG